MRTAARLIGLAGTLLLASLAAPAAAGQFDDLFFVRADPTAAAMLADRDGCAKEALALDIDASRGFSNPDYGVLTAMGSALQQDGGDPKVRKAVRRVVLIKCMEGRGWTEADVMEGDIKGLKRAAAKNPGELDAWLKAHRPAPKPPEPPAVAPAPKSAETQPVLPEEPTGLTDAPKPAAAPSAPR